MPPDTVAAVHSPRPCPPPHAPAQHNPPAQPRTAPTPVSALWRQYGGAACASADVHPGRPWHGAPPLQAWQALRRARRAERRILAPAARRPLCWAARAERSILVPAAWHLLRGARRAERGILTPAARRPLHRAARAERGTLAPAARRPLRRAARAPRTLADRHQPRRALCRRPCAMLGRAVRSESLRAHCRSV